MKTLALGSAKLARPFHCHPPDPLDSAEQPSSKLLRDQFQTGAAMSYFPHHAVATEQIDRASHEVKFSCQSLILGLQCGYLHPRPEKLLAKHN